MSAYALWQDSQGNNQVFTFDVVTDETQSLGNTITEHPVEQGADVTDHIRPNLAKVSLNGHVTQVPLYSQFASLQTVVLNLQPMPVSLTINGLENLFGNLISSGGTRTQNPPTINANVMAFNSGPYDFVQMSIITLEMLRTQGILVSLYCPNKIYDNMVLENYEVRRSARTGTGADVNTDWKQIRVVSSSITNAPVPVKPQASAPQHKGNQAPVQPPPQKASSLLFSALYGNNTQGTN